MAPGASSIVAVPVTVPPLSMGTQPSTSSSSEPRIPLSRKRPNAAALPSIGLIPPKKPTVESTNTIILPDDDELRKRGRHESDSSSQSSVSSQESSSDDLEFRLTDPSSALSTPGSTPSDNAPPPKQQHVQATTATQFRNAFHDRAVVVEKQQECARVIFCQEKQQSLGPILENATTINGFRIIGSGRDATALHLATNALYNVKLISLKDFQNTQLVAERLERAHEMCAEKDWDIDELCDAVLPCESEVVEEDLGVRGVRYMMFSPFEYSNLHVMASSANGGLPEEKVARYFKQIASIIAFCHQIGVVVRDFKPRKLVFSNETQTKIRLSDVFDVAVCDTVNDDVCTEKFGSPAYIPPEVLTARNSGFAGRPADVWGLGVLTFLMLTGKYPFYDKNPRGVFKKIRRAHVCFPSGANVSRTAREVVHCMLRKRPIERPNAELLTTVPWLPAHDSLGFFRERVNHIISPRITNSALLRRMSGIVPPSDVLSEHVVPITHLRLTSDGPYIGSSRRSLNVIDSSQDRLVPTAFPLTRYPLNQWPYSGEMESRLAVESRLPDREAHSTAESRVDPSIPPAALRSIIDWLQ
ncbi:hypothetical protein PFISCL1PPCAC_24206 [Pristionchus fissidentatus]|uniref:Protein kinase domain-containing protein n=1 Tax=Pristionchus fissidentatus TaxID=1538716 RepID=A0AAV5WQE1_9BILA|nr:hypothetical protein PFISCL1PPCAC_24206 [Pristionchus fissidentatus]